ncbi:MAG: starch synthase [Acidobacteriota bacterium]|jgi:starch synthase|nr:starch synthase [Acidobacteriota bacterium]
MRILIATAEVSPIAKTGGLGDVCGSLPKALAKLGHEVIVMMPFYRQARDWFDRNGVDVQLAHPTTSISWANWSADAAFVRTTLPGTDIPLVLVANDYFFDREHIYSPRLDGIDDNFDKFTFFSRAVIRGCELLGIRPDIIHAHDWHTALLPVYLHSGLRGSENFHNTRSVYTIHNLNYQGIAGANRFPILGLHDRYWAPDALEHFRDLNLMKGAIMFADQVTTVSPNYAREIQTSEHGAGLDGVLRLLSWKLTGILNGIDMDEWNPATDPFIAAHFDAGNLNRKAGAKRTLADDVGLKYKPNAPMLGVVSRLVDQKGFQLLIPILERLLAAGAQAVILGSGETQYEQAFSRIAASHPEDCCAYIGFENTLAHRIYAGADILLMPSIYEPCGLNQMYAQRYGTVPVVRWTGGLADTVVPFDGTNPSTATGFAFDSMSPGDLYAATWIAMLNYTDHRTWKTLQTNGMTEDFSWERSARQYEQIYQRAGA